MHGYYTLPILHHGHLIGRVDAKSHRVEGRLGIRHVHFEPWFAAGKTPPTGGDRLDQDETLGGLRDAFAALGTFVGTDEVVLRRVTPSRLRKALRRLPLAILSAAAIKELELAPAGARYTVGVRPRAWRNQNGSTTPRIDRALTDAGTRGHL